MKKKGLLYKCEGTNIHQLERKDLDLEFENRLLGLVKIAKVQLLLGFCSRE